MAEPTPITGDSDDDEATYSEVERQRKREKFSSYTKHGIPMSSKHKKWREGRRAADKAAAAQKAEMLASQLAENFNFVAELERQKGVGSNIEQPNSPCKRAIRIFSESEKNWHSLDATFDTGTADNWISVDTATQLNHVIKSVPISRFSTFTGEILESSEIMQEVRWTIDNGSGSGARSRYSDFRVAPESAPFVVLLGRDLIFSDAIFSFNEPALILTKLEETTEQKSTKEDNRKMVEAEARAIAVAKESAEKASKESSEEAANPKNS